MLVIHEVPGITPRVLDLGNGLVDAGLSVCIPQLFGTPGAPRTRGREVLALAEILRTRRFTTFRTNRTAPIADWLRALARSLSTEADGAPVGVLGLCIGGCTALAVATEDVVPAVAISEPCAPLGVVPAERRDINLSPVDRTAIAARADAGELATLGLRFVGDWFVPDDRFDSYRDVLGDSFASVDLIPSRRRRTRFSRCDHSVLTFDKRRHARHPANLAALEATRTRVTEFFVDQLSDRHP